MARPLKIGLALGGGAARAFSHVGVLAGLERHGIAVDLVTGTSMGAILGAMYVTHRDVAALKVRLADYLHSEEFARSGFDFFRELDAQGEGLLFRMRRMVRRGVFNTLMVTRAALVSDEIAARNYAYLIDDLTVAQGRLPFAAIALDLRSGARTILDRGRLRDIVAASCAMPGVLNPVDPGRPPAGRRRLGRGGAGPRRPRAGGRFRHRRGGRQSPRELPRAAQRSRRHRPRRRPGARHPGQHPAEESPTSSSRRTTMSPIGPTSPPPSRPSPAARRSSNAICRPCAGPSPGPGAGPGGGAASCPPGPPQRPGPAAGGTAAAAAAALFARRQRAFLRRSRATMMSKSRTSGRWSE